MKKRLASIVITMMLAFSTPAQAHQNILETMIIFHNLIHKLEQMDKSQLEYEIERTIIHNIEQWGKQKQQENKQKQQENNLKKVGKTG